MHLKFSFFSKLSKVDCNLTNSDFLKFFIGSKVFVLNYIGFVSASASFELIVFLSVCFLREGTTFVFRVTSFLIKTFFFRLKRFLFKYFHLCDRFVYFCES